MTATRRYAAGKTPVAYGVAWFRRVSQGVGAWSPGAGGLEAAVPLEKTWIWSATLVGIACGGATKDDLPGPDYSMLDQACPGAAECASNEGALRVGAAVVDLTPECWETWDDVDGNSEYASNTDVFYDCGCDRLCPSDDGYVAPDDGEGDGTFQALWLAGFGNGRAMASVHDAIEARAIVLESGDTSVAIVTLDVVGWFYDDTTIIREAVAAAGSTIDLVIVQATHNHEAPDTMGQWGGRFGERGVDERYMQQIIDGSVEAILAAESARTEVSMVVGVADSAAPFGDKGTANTVRDSRDPVVIDEDVGAAAFVDGSGQTVATLVNWGNHPEVLDDDNLELTSDFPWALRDAVENGLSYTTRTQAGRGGVTVYLQGTVGGLMTPLGVTVTDWDGVDHADAGFDKARALGDLIGGLALDALDSGETVDRPLVSFGVLGVELPIENFGFQALFLMEVFEREIFGYDDSRPFDDYNVPYIDTEMNLVTVGPLRMLTVPGELTPELAIGGYDGSRVNSSTVDFVDPTNPAPPDVSRAPQGPFLKEQMAGSYNWILGLGNDELGYFVPDYNYVLHPTQPYISEADGDHYEETNSLGPSAVPLVLEAAETLTTHSP